MNAESLKEIKIHCSEIYKCNQRGGRMFSVVDLLLADTITLDLAAFIVERVSSGVSFVVGANPGGAGKTTVMCAFINCIPNKMKIFHADSLSIIRKGINFSPSCFICHEISKGPYYAYLWGEELREFFKLKRYGHILATNLHADTYMQAKSQICNENGVNEESFYSIELYMFLELNYNKGWSVKRKINTVWYSEKGEPHNKIFDGSKLLLPSDVDIEKIKIYKKFLQHMIDKKVYLIEDFRKNLVEFRSQFEK